MSIIVNLKTKSIKLYFQYREGLITLKDYLTQIKAFQSEIDKLELKFISCYLADSPVLQRASLKHLH